MIGTRMLEGLDGLSLRRPVGVLVGLLLPAGAPHNPTTKGYAA